MLVGGWGRVGALLALLLLPASCQEEHPGHAPCQEQPGHAPTDLHPHPGHSPTDLLPHHLDGADASREPRIDSEFSHICLCKHFMRILLKFPLIGLTLVRCRNLVERILDYNAKLLQPFFGKRYTWKQSSHLMSLHVLCMWTFYCCWMARQVTNTNRRSIEIGRANKTCPVLFISLSFDYLCRQLQ